MASFQQTTTLTSGPSYSCYASGYTDTTAKSRGSGYHTANAYVGWQDVASGHPGNKARASKHSKSSRASFTHGTLGLLGCLFSFNLSVMYIATSMLMPKNK